jgi:hypothetical protein
MVTTLLLVVALLVSMVKIVQSRTVQATAVLIRLMVIVIRPCEDACVMMVLLASRAIKQ